MCSTNIAHFLVTFVVERFLEFSFSSEHFNFYEIDSCIVLNFRLGGVRCGVFWGIAEIPQTFNWWISGSIEIINLLFSRQRKGKWFMVSFFIHFWFVWNFDPFYAHFRIDD